MSFEFWRRDMDVSYAQPFVRGNHPAGQLYHHWIDPDFHHAGECSGRDADSPAQVDKFDSRPELQLLRRYRAERRQSAGQLAHLRDHWDSDSDRNRSAVVVRVRLWWLRDGARGDGAHPCSGLG